MFTCIRYTAIVSMDNTEVQVFTFLENFTIEPDIWWNQNDILNNYSYGNDSQWMDIGITAFSFINVMGIWITGMFCLLGFVGNVLSFIVLVRAFGKSPMFYVLRAVAVSDAFFLFSVFVIQFVVNVYPYTGMLQWCFDYRGYIQYLIWPVLMMTQMSTVWLTVLVSMERYIAICFPLRSASMCTFAKVRRCVIAIFIFSFLFNIPRYFEHIVTLNGIYNLEKSDISGNVVYRYLYMCVLYSLMLFLIPLVLLVLLNAKLVLALKRGKKQWQTLQVRQKKEQHLTIIPLTIVLVFFMCGTPALVVNIIEAIWQHIESEGFMQFLVVSNLLVVLNSAANFIIYCLLGKKFRSKLCEICKCKCRPTYRVVHQLVNTQMSNL